MRAFLLGVLIAIIQMSTAIFVLGWVWSIMWGINFIKRESRDVSLLYLVQLPEVTSTFHCFADSSMESEESLYPDHRESFEISSNSTSIYSNNIGYIKEVNSV
jgi:ABC-type nickel/cobalt efflux system permease component RcnA